MKNLIKQTEGGKSVSEATVTKLLIYFSYFLGATKHLYNWLCLLVGRLVGWLVGRLVGR